MRKPKKKAQSKKPKWVYILDRPSGDKGTWRMGDSKHWTKLWSVGHLGWRNFVRSIPYGTLESYLKDGWIVDKYLATDWHTMKYGGCLFWKESCLVRERVDALSMYA